MAEKQFVVFKLEKEDYGIGISNVKEIIPYKKSKKIPNTPDFIEGIINHRGDVTPIICLKKRFGINRKLDDINMRTIIINVNGKSTGFIVDEASQTISLNESEIDSAPSILIDSGKEFIDGVGKKEDRLILLIDLQKILTEKEKLELEHIKT